jgi:hypothetical protein
MFTVTSGVTAQPGATVTRLDPNMFMPFHWSNGAWPEMVCLRMPRCLWSGAVDIKAEGDHAICLRAAAIGASAGALANHCELCNA